MSYYYRWIFLQPFADLGLYIDRFVKVKKFDLHTPALLIIYLKAYKLNLAHCASDARREGGFILQFPDPPQHQLQ